MAKSLRRKKFAPAKALCLHSDTLSLNKPQPPSKQLRPTIMSYTYKYPRPALAVDCIVFGYGDADKLKVALVFRNKEPLTWALPGGFVHIDESTDEAAKRELREETGLSGIFLEQLFTFGSVERDTRPDYGRVVSVAHYALTNLDGQPLEAGSDADKVKWFDADDVPPLAFDHADILAMALKRLRGKARYEPIGFHLLPPKFTLARLQRLYEIILGEDLDKRNFRAKVKALGILEELDEMETGLPRPPARLYRFDKKAYKAKVAEGFHFKI